MLGQLGFLRKRCQRVTQGFFLRGIATEKQGRRHQPAPPPPPEPPEKIEWWAVDGELFKAEKYDPKRILAPLDNEAISNKRRRKDLIRHLQKTRLTLRIHKQDSYWAAYMKRFQILRDEWERHVWDPAPVPQPKHRHPAWVAEETNKYVWQDPRREAYTASVASRNAAQDPHGNAYTFDLSRMDESAIRTRFDQKIGYKGQGMSHSPYENRRNPGASSVRPGMTPLSQRNVDFARRRNLRPPSEFQDFDDVFNNEDTNKSQAEGKPSLSTEDEGDSESGDLFNWEKSENEDDDGSRAKAAGKDDHDDEDDEEDDDDSVDESEGKDIEQRRKGWFGDEDDLFKDEE